jgi:hypothetical protein
MGDKQKLSGRVRYGHRHAESGARRPPEKGLAPLAGSPGKPRATTPSSEFRTRGHLPALLWLRDCDVFPVVALIQESREDTAELPFAEG